MSGYRINPKVGDRLITKATWRMPQQEYVVVAVRRIKFDTVRVEDYERYQETGRGCVQTWRKDTACEDGSRGYNGPTIYTPESLFLEQRETAAGVYLKSEIGIETYRMKNDTIDRLTLANLIRRHLGEEEL